MIRYFITQGKLIIVSHKPIITTHPLAGLRLDIDELIEELMSYEAFIGTVRVLRRAADLL